MKTLKVVHVPYTFAPDSVGGTEIYVETLAHGLKAHGVESLVVAPSAGGDDQAYEHGGLRVRRFRSASDSDDMLREAYGGGDPVAAAAFAEILDEETPDAVHLHSFSRAVSVRFVRAARQRGIPVLFTYHTPTVSCQRGTLMLWGARMCDGVLDVGRCTSCSMQSRGMPRWATGVLNGMPSGLAKAVDKSGRSGGLWTALRMPELVRRQQEAFHSLMREVDVIITLSEWSRTVLIRNGIPESKVARVQHWLPSAPDAQGSLLDVASVPLKVAFLGRAVRIKGADTLIRAMLKIPDVQIELHLYGVAQDANDEGYWAELRSLAAHDPRIKFLPSVPNDKVVSLLKGYHLLAMPARGVENRPLVLLESIAAGTPIIGSDLGGVAELVNHMKDGLLVDPEDVSGWADALRSCAEDRSLLSRLRNGVRMPRARSDVAEEMAKLYFSRVRRPAVVSSDYGRAQSMRAQYRPE